MAGVMNLEQMSRSLRSFLFMRLSLLAGKNHGLQALVATGPGNLLLWATRDSIKA
jgi:hypothetical protein